MKFDPDGQAAYMVYWGNSVTHAAIAVDVRGADGRPTGRVVVAGKWPGSGGAIGDYGKWDAKREADNGKGVPGTIVGGEGNISDVFLGASANNGAANPLTGETVDPTAIVRIETTPEQDASLGATLRSDLQNKATPEYKGQDGNCATYVKDKAQSVGIKTGSGKESVTVKGKTVTIDTPNRVIKGTVARNPETTKIIKGKKEDIKPPSM